MKRFGSPLLSMAAPFLIVLAIVALFQREGADRLQCLPALIVGFGLMISGAMERIRHRKKLLKSICNRSSEEN